MPDVLIRDLDDDVLKQLKAAAKANGRSLQAEIHAVLRRANTRNLAETRRLSSRWLKRIGHTTHSDSAAAIREDRDAPYRAEHPLLAPHVRSVTDFVSIRDQNGGL